MGRFIHEDFLLNNRAAVRLYHDYAAMQPILDYHNHLSPGDIANDRRFANLYEMWLEHDHYKWRAMRANGVGEEFCTGNAPPKEKFLAFARTTPATLRNPLYHWTHLELKRFFGLDLLLNEATAEQVWHECNHQLQHRSDLSTQGILNQFRVTALCTTDDPVDRLEHHRQLKSDSRCSTAVYPTFRPDWAMSVHQPEAYRTWIGRLERLSQVAIRDLGDLLAVLRKRHDDFHELGSRLSDHGLECISANICDDQQADLIFRNALAGKAASVEEQAAFATHLLSFFARLDAEKGWTKQLHLGVWRNNNTRLFQQAGRDIGCDSMSDTNQGWGLGQWLDRLDREGKLPKVIVYNLNPRDNYLIATMLGNFSDGKIAGKMQLGSGWWFLDQQEGIEWQLNTLSNTGLLARFVGMLTDSRSFMSLTRHEYFRRILCNRLGEEIERGELPSDWDLIGTTVSNICYGNAQDFFGLATKESFFM
jgi:glucuronate isomerase